MSYPILKGSAVTPLLFYLTLASDHVSPATGLSPTVTISKNGGAYGSPAGAVSEIANGMYQVAAHATDSNTAGPVAVHAAVATADNFDGLVAFVVDPTVALYGVNAVQLNAQTITAAAGVTFPASVASPTNITAGTITPVTNVTNAPTAGDLTATMKTSVQTAADAAITANVTVIEINADVDEIITTLGTPVGASVSADVAAVPASVWATTITGATTAIQGMRGFLAALLGKASGLDVNAPVYRDIADTKNVISATTDSNGNRSNVTLNLA